RELPEHVSLKRAKDARLPRTGGCEPLLPPETVEGAGLLPARGIQVITGPVQSARHRRAVPGDPARPPDDCASPRRAVDRAGGSPSQRRALQAHRLPGLLPTSGTPLPAVSCQCQVPPRWSLPARALAAWFGTP